MPPSSHKVIRCESTEPRVYPHWRGAFRCPDTPDGRQGLTDHKARQPKGIFTDGQFDAAGHTESDVTTEAPTTRKEALTGFLKEHGVDVAAEDVSGVLDGIIANGPTDWWAATKLELTS